MRWWAVVLVVAMGGCFPDTRPLTDAERLEAERVGVAVEEALGIEISDAQWRCILDVRVAVVDDPAAVCHQPAIACYTISRAERRDGVIVFSPNPDSRIVRHELGHRLRDCVSGDPDKDHVGLEWPSISAIPHLAPAGAP
jgi:hypothetical protein